MKVNPWIRASLIGTEGRFVTLPGWIRKKTYWKPLEMIFTRWCSDEITCVRITGVWRDSSAEMMFPRSQAISHIEDKSELQLDATGVSDMFVLLDGPLKLMRYDRKGKLDCTVYGNITAHTGMWTCLSEIYDESPECDGQYEARIAFEKLELEKRPRINLELSSKIPGDVNVCCEMERKNLS